MFITAGGGCKAMSCWRQVMFKTIQSWSQVRKFCLLKGNNLQLNRRSIRTFKLRQCTMFLFFFNEYDQFTCLVSELGPFFYLFQTWQPWLYKGSKLLDFKVSVVVLLPSGYNIPNIEPSWRQTAEPKTKGVRNNQHTRCRYDTDFNSYEWESGDWQ